MSVCYLKSLSDSLFSYKVKIHILQHQKNSLDVSVISLLFISTLNMHFHFSLSTLHSLDTGVLLFSKSCLFVEYYMYFKFFL